MFFSDFLIFHHFTSQKIGSRELLTDSVKKSASLVDCLFEMVANRSYELELPVQVSAWTGTPFISQAFYGSEREGQLTEDDWVILSYGVGIREMIDNNWDTTYGPISQSESVMPECRSSLLCLKQFLNNCPIQDLLTQIEKKWEPRSGELIDTAILYLIWHAAMLGFYGKPSLYQRAWTFLSPSHEMLNVYMAAACWKREDVTTACEGSFISDIQYGCVRLFDTFSELQGPPCG